MDLSLVRERRVRRQRVARADYRRLAPLPGRRVESRGWTPEVLRCVRDLGELEFVERGRYRVRAPAEREAGPESA